MDVAAWTRTQTGKTPDQAKNGFLRLSSCQMGAEAQMATTTKRLVVGILPGDVKPFRIRINRGIMIGSSQRRRQ